MSDAITPNWYYELPSSPMEWDDEPEWNKGSNITIALPSYQHALDFVDNLEHWLKPPCAPDRKPAWALTLAQSERFWHLYATWCRRWGRLTIFPVETFPPEVQPQFRLFENAHRFIKLESWEIA